MSTTIHVQNSEELRTAISQAEGGEKIVLANNGEKYKVSLWKPDLDELPDSVTITSEDPDNPAVIDQILLQKLDNLVFEDLAFSGEPRTGHNKPDLILKDCANIKVVNCTFKNSAEAKGERGDANTTAISVTGSEGVTVEDCEISHYLRGISHRNNVDLEFVNNSFHHIQEDGIRGGGVDGMTISGNVFEDWFSIDSSWLHADFIQIWSHATSRATENVLISDNVFLGQDEQSAQQVIFARNDEIDMFGGDPEEWMFRNWTITNNLIDSDASAGIKLAYVDGLDISENTLIGNSRIQVFQSENGTIENNITVGFSFKNNSNLEEVNNLIVQEYDQGNLSYSESVFANLALFRDTDDVRQLVLSREFMETGGMEYGADMFTLPLARDGVVLVIDESSFSFETPTSRVLTLRAFDGEGNEIEVPGDEVLWQLSDGKVVSGREVVVDFEDRSLSEVSVAVLQDGAVVGGTYTLIEHPPEVLFELGTCETGFVDVSACGGTVQGDAATSVFDPVLNRDVMVMSETGNIRINPNSAMIDLPTATIEMTLQRLDADAGHGSLLGKSNWFKVEVMEDGGIRFTVIDPHSSQPHYVYTEEGLLSDTDWHHVVVVMDNIEDYSAKLYVDGALVAECDTPWDAGTGDDDFSLGNRWNASLNAKIADFKVTSLAADAAEVEALCEAAIKEDGVPSSAVPIDVLPVFDLDITNAGLADTAHDQTSLVYDSDIIVFDEALGAHVVDVPDSSVRIKTGADLGGTPEMSVALAYQRHDAQEGNGNIIGQAGWFQVNLRDNGELHFKLIDQETKKHYDVFTSGADLEDTDWHHILVTIDTEEDQVARLYLDGELEAEIFTDTAFRGTDAQFSLGNRFGKSLDGKVSDLQVFDEAFDAEYAAREYAQFSQDLAATDAFDLMV